jgi:phosphoenolpyruvate-protein kinase (PTS system EI component)
LLLPQDQLQLLNNLMPSGLIVVDAAPYSHNMIQRLGSGIPLVILSGQQADLLPPDCYLRVDGHSGEIKTVAPDTPLEYAPPNLPLSGQSIATSDGVEIHMNASVSSTAAAVRALEHGAAAIGLVRTELLQPADGSLPDKEYYLRVFSELCEAAKPLAVTIRLLDLAPDKKPRWLPWLQGMQGPCGLQGVRLYQLESVSQVVHAQLAAIKTLAAKFQIKILIPFVTLSQEFCHWRDLIKTMAANPFPVGAMLETPAAVLALDYWLAQADFVSIGCNDLMQNLFAADRDLSQLKAYLNPYSPALLRFLHQAASSAGDNIHKIQLCGLLPQWPGILPLLIAMGFRRFSVEPLNIPYLAQSVSTISVEKIQPVIEQVCTASSADAVCRILNVPVWQQT